jgi:enoyl-CoA hydratase/carnithine racemase
VSSPEQVRLTELGRGAARLTLTRAERRNAIGAELAEEFGVAVATMRDQGVIAAVLDAEGPAFCAGADLAELPGSAIAVDQVLEHLTEGSIHWSAVVRGAVRGAGLALLAACPRVLATPEATFGLPELDRGFFPADLMSGQVRAIGTRAAFELAFSAEPVSAATAHGWGLVAEVVPDADLDGRAQEVVMRLAGRPPEAVRTGLAKWCERARADLNVLA